jgi:hypothetical protein
MGDHAATQKNVMPLDPSQHLIDLGCFDFRLSEHQVDRIGA